MKINIWLESHTLDFFHNRNMHLKQAKSIRKENSSSSSHTWSKRTAGTRDKNLFAKKKTKVVN